MKISKEKIITISVLLILTILLYNAFLPWHFSIDTEKIVDLGYKGYALNYSFYDGRIVMGIICMIAQVVSLHIKIFNMILLVMAIIVSVMTVMKIIEIIKNIKRPKGILQYILLVIISYLYIFNFMTIDNMQFAECFVMALSVWFYILSAENIIIKNNVIKSLIYCILGVFCYQGTINMFIITVILLELLEKNNISKKNIKDFLISAGIVIISVILNLAFIKIVANYINRMQNSRLSLEILKNIIINFKELPYLIFGTIDLFPTGCWIILMGIILTMAYINAVKKTEWKVCIISVALLLASIISSLLLLLIYEDGIMIMNGRIFGSIGASFSVLWIYLYTKTDILDTKNVLQYVSIAVVSIYFILNIYNILNITHLLKESNLIDKQLAKKIEQEIMDYEKDEKNKIEYIAIGYWDRAKSGYEKCNKIVYLKSMKLIGLFDENVLKIYTNVDPNLEKIYFEDEIREKYFKEEKEDEIKCIDNTVYVMIK